MSPYFVEQTPLKLAMAFITELVKPLVNGTNGEPFLAAHTRFKTKRRGKAFCIVHNPYCPTMVWVDAVTRRTVFQESRQFSGDLRLTGRGLTPLIRIDPGIGDRPRPIAKCCDREK